MSLFNSENFSIYLYTMQSRASNLSTVCLAVNRLLPEALVQLFVVAVKTKSLETRTPQLGLPLLTQMRSTKVLNPLRCMSIAI